MRHRTIYCRVLQMSCLLLEQRCSQLEAFAVTAGVKTRNQEIASPVRGSKQRVHIEILLQRHMQAWARLEALP